MTDLACYEEPMVVVNAALKVGRMTAFNTARGWYHRLLAECEEIHGHTRWVSSALRIRTKWRPGQRITEDPNYEMIIGGEGCKGFVGKLATDLGTSKRDLQRCAQFYRKTLDLLIDSETEAETAARVTQYLEPPDGKVPTWKWIVEDFLPDRLENDSAFWVPDALTESGIEVLDQIDLDPCCAHGPNVPANSHLSEDEGLNQPWLGCVFLVPPAGRKVEKWVAYLLQQYEQGATCSALALLPAATDAAWFRSLREYPKCLLWTRPKLGPADARLPMLVVYFGQEPGRFTRVFSNLGDVYLLAPPAGPPITARPTRSRKPKDQGEDTSTLNRTKAVNEIDQLHMNFEGRSAART